MAYEKHTWSCGETVTADLLNHMEDGIAEGAQNGIVIAKLTLTSETTAMCSLSHDEIVSLTESNVPVLVTWSYQPEGAPFVVESGSHLVDVATGLVSIRINNEEWVNEVAAGNNWRKS